MSKNDAPESRQNSRRKGCEIEEETLDFNEKINKRKGHLTQPQTGTKCPVPDRFYTFSYHYLISC